MTRNRASKRDRASPLAAAVLSDSESEPDLDPRSASDLDPSRDIIVW